MTTIHITPDYRLNVEVSHLSTGEQHLRITSSWLCAERTMLEVTLPPERMKELATAVLCGSYDHQYTGRT